MLTVIITICLSVVIVALAANNRAARRDVEHMTRLYRAMHVRAFTLSEGIEAIARKYPFAPVARALRDLRDRADG